MCIVTAAVMALALAVSSLSHAAKVGLGDNWYPGEGLTQRSTQSYVFNGISLTEHQYQQIQDLMQRTRHEQPPVDVSELETMHRLVTAGNFDEDAVRAQAEGMVNEQVARRIEMAKVRNQIHRLLASEQQTTSNGKH